MYLIEAKVRVPPIRHAALIRPRVADQILTQIDAADVVWIVATAGAGKTTAVVHTLQDGDLPTAWVRVDNDDMVPGRFLLYLEKALLEGLPGHRPLIESALERGIPHPECAALLAQSVGDAPVIVVIDEVERIGHSSAVGNALASFLRYAQPRTTTLLISRRELDLGLAGAKVQGRVAYIGESDLAFTVEEAAEALARLDLGDIDANAAVDATGGWITGVLFESWHSAEHVHGAGGEGDPLSNYLSSEIMDSLDPDLRDFLIRTSILDTVTAEHAVELGISRAPELLGRLRSAHLPVLFDGAQVMRCHTRFREYLLDRWKELDAPVQSNLRLRHGRLLVEQQRWEDAVGEFLAAGDVDQAEDTAEHVIISVARRLDFDLIERWLCSFRPWRIDSSPALTAAQLLVAVDREQFGRAACAADRLQEVADEEFQNRERLHGAMAWSYFLSGRIADAYRTLDCAPDDLHARAIRFCIGVEMIDDPTHYRDRPADPHTELDGLLARVDLAHGRFLDLAGRAQSPQRAVRLAQVGALTGLGRLAEAWSLLPAAATGWTGTRILAELLAESGRPEEAWSELIAGRELLSHSESPLYRMFALLTEVMLALRFRRDVALARAALRAVAQEPTALKRIRVVEQIALWSGLIALLEDNTAEALHQLRKAVEVMTGWDRRLFLPTAATYLAEAEWRAGNEEASDRAADLALQVASQTGSTHGLSRALRDFPSVLSRRLDIETDPDGPWHDLGRTLVINAEAPDAVHTRPDVYVCETDQPAVLVGGRRHEPKLVKTVELLGYLAVEGPEVSRTNVISALFDSKNNQSAQTYLRQAINGVRHLTGDPGCLVAEGTRLRWTRGWLSSNYVETVNAHRRMRTVTGAQRLELAREVLARVSGREVLPGARSPWAVEHREAFATLIRDIRHTAAEAAFETADYPLAHRLIKQVLSEDPYRERAWRLAMKIASAVGDTDGLIASYRACECALQELPAAPSAATRDLFDRLRV